MNVINNSLSWLLGGEEAHCAPQPVTMPPAMTPMNAGSVGEPSNAEQPTEVAKPVPVTPAVVSSERPNPGSFDRADQDAKIVLTPNVFSGFQCEIRKGLNPNFSLNHNIVMGNTLQEEQNTYNFGATLANATGSFAMAGFDHKGGVDAKLGYQSEKVHALLISKLDSDVNKSMFSPQIDLLGKDFTAGLKLGNGYFGCSYFQSITPNLALGGDGIHITQRRMTAVNARAKYFDDKNQLVFSYVGLGSLACSYHRKVTPKIALATEMEFVPANRQSHVTVGYQILFAQSKFCGVIDSNYTIQTTLEEIMAPGFRLQFSAILDHNKEAYRFGVGVAIGE